MVKIAIYTKMSQLNEIYQPMDWIDKSLFNRKTDTLSWSSEYLKAMLLLFFRQIKIDAQMFQK